MNRVPLCYSLALACCLFAGCGKLVSVEGKAVLDGKPLGGATLLFFPEDNGLDGDRTRQAHTMTDGDGHFRMDTVNKQGTVPGRYKVVIYKIEYPPRPKEQAKPDPADAMRSTGAIDMMRMGGQGKQILPNRYTSERETPISVEIPKQGTKSLIIELKSKD